MFTWQAELLPGVRGAFTSAEAGNLAFHVGDDASGVRRNRAAVHAALGLDAVQYMNQVHGKAVTLVEDITFETDAPTADGLLSRGVPLAVMVADCVPVLLAGVAQDGSPVLAAVHAGRPGMALGIVPEAVSRMRELGATELAAWLGPSVCGRCYEVPGAMRDEIAGALPAAGSETSWGTPALDIPAGVVSQLSAIGVPVLYRGECTMEHTSLFSHRRAPGEGRFAGIIWQEGR
ncbi:polyphenol oxidase family protein [Arthrobacter sp. NPDC090010]|uniref:polyphenol oxidase family protein n=1 Tax=Arthrobacter sp. NPDC090010 TaxID=3363942 RepID=UPI0037F76C75